MIVPGGGDFWGVGQVIAPAPEASFRWGTVVNNSPLSVILDGDSWPLVATPDTLVDPRTLSEGDRVWVQLYSRRVIVVGTANPREYGAVPLQANLLKNPFLLNGATDWSSAIFFGAAITQAIVAPPSNLASPTTASGNVLRMTFPSVPSSFGLTNGNLVAPLVVGRRYELAVAVAAPAGNRLWAGNPFGDNTFVNASGGWQTLRVSFVATAADTVRQMLSVDNNAAAPAAVYYLAGASLIEGSTSRPRVASGIADDLRSRLPGSDLYVGRMVNELSTGMLWQWTGTRWRWVGGQQQMAHWQGPSTALTAAQATTIPAGTRQPEGGAYALDPAGAFYSASNEVRVRVAGLYYLSCKITFNINSPPIVAYLNGGGDSHGAPVTSGATTTMTAMMRLAADTGFNAGVHLYSGSCTATSTQYRIVCLSEVPA